MNALESLLVDRGVKFTATHVGLVENDDLNQKKSWLHDEWRVTIELNGKSYSDKYMTGIGHRKLAFGVKNEGRKYYTISGVVAFSDKEACEKNLLLVPHIHLNNDGTIRKEDKGYPKAWEVVCAWLGDANCDMSFESWASEYGYNSDSISYREIYLHCQRIRDGIRRVFGDAMLAELHEAAQDC